MYTEEPRRSINWGSIIKKGLVVLLIAAVIFLIIWLFARNNSKPVDVNYEDENTNVTETLTNPDAYSESFINNYRYFHDTAKEYFLISELPTEGNTLKYTLQQLIDKGLILPFSYENGTCDQEASYVTVTNENGKYTMTTTLICGKEVAKTTEELGCNQLCDKNCTESTALEYQYKQAYKATENVYSCPSGYTKSGTKCIKSTSSTIAATKTTTYTCPEGYTKSGTKCYKNSNDAVDANYKYVYSCPSGYTKSGSDSNTKCTKTTTSSVNATANTTYTCAEGTLSGTKCVITTTSKVNATANTTYTCPSGYTKSGSGSNTKCTITKAPTTNTTNYCASGYDKNGNSCVKYIYTDISYGSTYNGCTGGQLVKFPCSSGNCTTSKYMYVCTKGVSSKTTYTCPSGYTKSGSGSSTKCTKTTTATPKTTYSCSKGTLSGTECVITNTSNVNAKSNTTYSCSKGTLSGTKCIISNTSSTQVLKDTQYYCEKDGYNLNGTKCYKLTTTSKEATKNTSYTCPSGYNKVGLGSSAKCTIGTTSTIDATKSTKTVTKYKYKWSTETSLNGWEKTGKTRNVSSN